jgi:hypothetical protein
MSDRLTETELLRKECEIFLSQGSAVTIEELALFIERRDALRAASSREALSADGPLKELHEWAAAREEEWRDKADEFLGQSIDASPDFLYGYNSGCSEVFRALCVRLAALRGQQNEGGSK